MKKTILTAKKIQLLFAGLLFVPFAALAQKPKIDSNYIHPHYQQRAAYFRSMPDRKNEIVFLGNSITEHGEWQELLGSKRVVNRGIGGDNTFGVLARLDEVLSSKPARIYLLIGINDLSRRLPAEVIVNNYKRIIARVKKESPHTKLYIESVLPVNESMVTASYLKGITPLITDLNTRIKELTAAEKLTYIDLHPLFEDNTGQLKADWSRDGIHLKPEAYIEWINFLKTNGYLK